VSQGGSRAPFVAARPPGVRSRALRGRAGRCLAALAAAAAILVGGVGCSLSSDRGAGSFEPSLQGTVRVATAAVPTPGLWEGTAERPTGGFEYELARAIAERLGVERVEVVEVPFQRLVAGDLGGADMALSLVTPTKERERGLDFSDPYLDVPPAVVVRSGVAVPDLKTARRLRWVTVKATTLEGVVDGSIEPTSPTLRVSRRPEAVAALEAGRADAVLFDFPLAVAYAERSHGSLAVAAKLEQPEEIAAALPKGSPNLDAVSSAIRALTADGTVNRLAVRWLGSAASEAGSGVPLLRSER
jgi:polar amino acid transport system substrate-binding protein